MYHQNTPLLSILYCTWHVLCFASWGHGGERHDSVARASTCYLIVTLLNATGLEFVFAVSVPPGVDLMGPPSVLETQMDFWFSGGGVGSSKGFFFLGREHVFRFGAVFPHASQSSINSAAVA